MLPSLSSRLRKREIDTHSVKWAHALSTLGFFQQADFRQDMHIPMHRFDIPLQSSGKLAQAPFARTAHGFKHAPAFGVAAVAVFHLK